MKKRIFAIIAAVLIAATLVSCKKSETEKKKGRTAVDEKYAYNTSILHNENAPTADPADIKAIDGYVDGEIEGLKLPMNIGETHLVIDSVGGYTGKYVEDLSMDDCKDVFALVVRNSSDSVVSYASFSIQYGSGEEEVCDFTATNLPAGRSVLLLSSDKKLLFSKIRQLEVTDSMEVLSDSLIMLDGTVGVDHKDGAFILTNLTEDSLGTVYIRYKYLTGGNAYLGGVTGSVSQANVSPFETYILEQTAFDPAQCEIICVEHDENTVFD